ncbi:MAG TPA: 16S rRNA (adenine(1518)-N(6)/adenine(1519)-N(6))-dimethyltransferase RsmA [Paludibacteraceae bacterium]|nr:16S rRNA (adenine(1518)-N(6)/adenine(1519)-N(6))-dimethyltransferase RsmA [Paludibacteraceae bacterium]HOL00512.1 16S rRNA (adenine(1518)-N(6)/adenine(1519)-N(6))-dimethyltransferase RsmA [Paludibacteraceae bacterium]HPO67260.1 16S rRNA (adenine(1518)-N(6)/adenine(1519)-N(6))-dimethyltransferase RsmA [Paludibacteraceae bacterium]
MAEVKAKKYLGQHFLKDKNVARRIVESLPIQEKTSVLEIGPGMGILTQFLINQPLIDLVAIEIDHESVIYLHKHFPNLKVIEGDFLQLDLQKIFSGEFYIIGNFPYNISSQIFFKLLENKDIIPSLTGMVQKEVAERLAALPGSKIYGILSVLLQAYYKVEYLFTVDENVFQPPPKVKSAVIQLTRNENLNIGCNEKLFKTVVKTAFNQRRKTLRNSLEPLIEKNHEIYKNSFFDKRPEQLDVTAFIQLTNQIEKAMKQ